MRELRGQFTAFLLAGGLALSLLEASRRMASEPQLAAFLRVGAAWALGLGCAAAGLAMLAAAVADLRAKASVLVGVRHRRAALPAPLRAVLGAALGLGVPAALIARAVSG